LGIKDVWPDQDVDDEEEVIETLTSFKKDFVAKKQELRNNLAKRTEEGCLCGKSEEGGGENLTEWTAI
jgi:hypothetical protein